LQAGHQNGRRALWACLSRFVIELGKKLVILCRVLGSGISTGPFTLPEEQWIIVNFNIGRLVDKDIGV